MNETLVAIGIGFIPWLISNPKSWWNTFCVIGIWSLVIATN